MNPNLIDALPPDVRIDATNRDELGYWGLKFRVSADTLLKAIQQVGPMISDLELYLTR
ncbi:MAG: DUF3606 domain-containing protein [Betaproteobacteria bacterium]